MASLKAKRSLSDLGSNLRQARLARRFSMAELAIRADVSERTLMRLEKGDPGVGIGNLASVLAALGNPAALADIMSPENDAVGFTRALQSVPKRGRSFAAAKAAPVPAENGSGPAAAEDKPPARKGVGF